jgi:putative PEP-CTERM system TPR-repeat lipoprotein
MEKCPGRTVRAGRPVIFMLLCAAMQGCQPSFEERISSAETYLSTGEYAAAIIELKNALREAPDDAKARELIANASYHVADFETAADEYARALELGRETVDNWIGLGESLLRTGRAVEAFERVQPNLDANSSNPKELVALAHLYASLGNTAEAGTLFQRARVADSRSVDAHIGLAVIAASNSDFAGAYKLLDEAITADPASPRPWLVRGNLARVQLDNAAAVKYFRKAVSLEVPSTPLAEKLDARSALTSTAIEVEDFDLARRELAALEPLAGGSPAMFFLRGRLAFAEGDADAAARELTQYLSVVPGDLRAHAVMGAISFTQSYYSQAEMYLQRAVNGEAGGEAARRLLAETQLRLRRPESAIDLLADDGASGSADAELLGLLGRAQFSAGNSAEGLAYLSQALEAAPDDLNTRLLYVSALIETGRNAEAIEQLESMQSTGGADYRREVLLIVARNAAGDTAAALAAADELLAAYPNDASVRAVVGSFKRGLGRNDEAINHFKDALSIDSSNESALFGLASVSMEQGEVVDAERALVRLLDQSPANVAALAMLANILEQNNDLEAIDRRLAAAIEAAPNLPGPQLLKARFDLFQGNAELALRTLQVARDKFPELASFRHLEGLALLQLGRTEYALSSLARAAADDPATPQHHLDLALARLRVSDYAGATDAMENFRELRPEDAVGLSVLIGALIRAERLEDAANALNDYVPPDENAANVQAVLRGDLAMARNDVGRAVELYEQASTQLWNRSVVLRLSTAYREAGSADATVPLERWLSENPDDAAARRAYAQLLQEQGDGEQAIALYQRVLESNSNDPVALNNLAWEYAQNGKEGALELAERAYELRPDIGSIADTYGWILYLEGRSDDAVNVLREAVELSPNNGEIQYHLAMALAKTGDMGEARMLVDELIESGVNFPSRRAALAFAESGQ